MDPELEALLGQELREQDAGGALTGSSVACYAEKLAAWWRSYAEPRGLPQVFGGASGRSLAPGELVTLIGAAHTGDLRRLTREGDGRDRTGEPLAVSSLGGLFAALRHAHERAGLAWHGHAPEVVELRRAYGRAHLQAPRKAAAMAAEHAVALFGCPPHAPLDPDVAATRARAIALALGVPLRDLPKLTPEAVVVSGRDAVVTLSGRTVTVPCLRSVVGDAVAAVACPHCALGDWVAHVDELGPLLRPGDVRSFQACVRGWVRRVPGLRFTGDVLTSVSGDPWTTVAAGLPPAAQAWLRARAVLLPMRAVGLRLDDIDGLRTGDVHITEEIVTFSVTGKGEHAGTSFAVTLEATGDAMCPVRAVNSYERWVRAHGCDADRSRWVVPLRGKAPNQYPVQADVPDGSRALYQSIRLWLVEHSRAFFTDDGTDWTHLTPHSARRGYAAQAQAEGYAELDVQDALRHKRLGTTLDYLEDAAAGMAARRLLDAIAKERRGTGG